MRKLFLLVCCIAISSCGTSKVAQEARKTIDGNWTLTSITFPGNPANLNVLLFNDTTAKCLENSSWYFVSNNNTGYYAVSNMNCNTDRRFFRWSVSEVNATAGNYDLMLKPTNADYESTTGDSGFRINLVTVSETTMVWEQVVNFEGSPFTIQLNFTKI